MGIFCNEVSKNCLERSRLHTFALSQLIVVLFKSDNIETEIDFTLWTNFTRDRKKGKYSILGGFFLRKMQLHVMEMCSDESREEDSSSDSHRSECQVFH